jgi:hypothetical protein
MKGGITQERKCLRRYFPGCFFVDLGGSLVSVRDNLFFHAISGGVITALGRVHSSESACGRFCFGRGRGRFGLVVGGEDEGWDGRGGGVGGIPLPVALRFCFGIQRLRLWVLRRWI